jgi:dTDP-4-amino-4,6-dideoxygalactose transaminase
MQFRDLKKQYEVLRADIDRSVNDVFSETNFISGIQVTELEKRLTDYVGVKHCITCANGTDALQLVLMAWGIGSGDAVFVPDFTFFATGEVVSLVRATPVFYDVNEDTYNADTDSLESAIKAVLAEGKLKPKVVIDVDLFGLPADHEAIGTIAKKYDMLLLEDSAQGFGGSIKGKINGNFGDAATTSFFPSKPLGCYGDGGAIFTNDDKLAELLRSLCVHGKGSFKYDNIRIGLNSRLDTIQAAILKVKFDAFCSYELSAVNKVADWYDKALADVRVKRPVIPDGFFSSWAQYTIQLTDHVQREALQAALKEQGIPTMIYYPKPMHMQKAFHGNKLYVECPVTVRLCDTVLSLPMHPYLEELDIDMISNCLRHFCR